MTVRKTQVINGVEYVYLDTSIWNSEKKRAEHKRKYIGKIVDGKFVPNKEYKLEMELEKKEKESTKGPKKTEVCVRKFYGASYLLGEIADKLGVSEDLWQSFGEKGKEILSLAYYLVLEQGQPMYRFHKWGLTHVHPNERDIPSQRCSELFTSIREDDKMEYLRRQANRNGSSQYLAFDSTSISSYSTLIKQVKYGKNKEGDKLPQLNLLLLYGQESLIPLYYRKLPGNVTDVMIVSNMLKDVDYLNIEKLKFVFDRGFYSEKNINNLMKYHYKFICGAKLSLNLIKRHLEEAREDFTIYDNYNDKLGLHMCTFTDEWIYKEEMVRSGEIVSEPRRIYVHLYYNEQKATDEKVKFNRSLGEMEECIRSGNIESGDKKEYSRFFDIRETPKRGVTYTPKNDAIREAMKNFGYFALMSNDIKDPVTALEIYRNKDTIEKSFGDLKDRLSMRRMSVSSEEGFEGKLFVQFVALSLLSYIKKKMDENGLFKNYTMQSLLDELDIIEYYHQPGKAHHVSEITSKQKKIYECMGVPTPT